MAGTEPYRTEVSRLVESGWRIEEETADRVTLVKRNFGTAGNHVIIAVLTLWWTMGVGNALYALYKYLSDSERTIVWKEGGAGSATETEPEPTEPIGTA